MEITSHYEIQSGCLANATICTSDDSNLTVQSDSAIVIPGPTNHHDQPHVVKLSGVMLGLTKLRHAP